MLTQVDVDKGIVIACVIAIVFAILIVELFYREYIEKRDESEETEEVVGSKKD